MKKFLLFAALIGNFAFAEAQEKKDDTSQAQWAINHSYRVYQAALGLNDLEAAKGALLDILVEIPKNDSILFNLAQIYFELQNYVAAGTCAAEVVKGAPNNLGAVEIAAVSFENIGAKEQAVSYFEKLYLKTDDFSSLYKTTMLQFDLKRFAEAAVNIDILLSRKESDEAKLPLITLDNKQKEYPLRVVLLNLKGMTKEQQGDKAGATEAYKQAVALAPDFSTAVENLKNIQAKK